MQQPTYSHIHQILVAADQLGNAIALGWADETWSARCWREQRSGWIAFLNLFQKDHCKKAFESEVLRRQLPMEYR